MIKLRNPGEADEAVEVSGDEIKEAVSRWLWKQHGILVLAADIDCKEIVARKPKPTKKLTQMRGSK